MNCFHKLLFYSCLKYYLKHGMPLNFKTNILLTEKLIDFYEIIKIICEFLDYFFIIFSISYFY